jgi:hypothetical protein
MDIIPIQASSVPCERVFSSGKQTMTPRRLRISAQLMESLQILKFSIRKERPLKFTEGMSWSEELKEFEFLARTAPPGDAEAYGRSLVENTGGHEGDSDDLMDALDKLGVNLEVLGEQHHALEDNKGNEDDEEDMYL